MAVRRHGAVIPAIVDGKLLEFRFADAPALAQTAVPIIQKTSDCGHRAVRAFVSLFLLQLVETHPVNSPFNHDLGVLAIANIAAENTGAPFPQDRHAGAPDRADLGGC